MIEINGVRYPEDVDSPIYWPRLNVAAVWDRSSLAWYVTGSSRVYGYARLLIAEFGADWESLQ